MSKTAKTPDELMSMTDSNYCKHALYEIVKSQQQEIEQYKTWHKELVQKTDSMLEANRNLCGKLQQKDEALRLAKQGFEDIQDIWGDCEHAQSLIDCIDKALGGKDPNERICPHCGNVGYSASEDARCHKCGLRPKEDKK